MVTFSQVPAGLRVPGVFVEFDSSRAQQGAQVQPYRLLVIGQRTSAGTVAELVPTLVTNADDASVFFGAGSMLHGMAEVLFQANRFTEAWFVAQDDPAGAAATKTITVTGTATQNGVVYLYVAGRRLTIAVASGDVQNTIAAAIEAELDAKVGQLPFTASVASNVVTLTAKNIGAEGELLDVRVNYNAGENLPAGVAIAVAAGATGTLTPDIDDVWPVLGEVQYNVLAVAYTDASTKTKVDAELADRDGALRMIGGRAIIGTKDTLANLVTLGSGLNSRYFALPGQNNSPTPPYEWAASVAGVVALHAQADPGRPFQTLELPGVLAPAIADRFTFAEQQTLLENGIATYGLSPSGAVLIGRLITTYQKNAVGADDIAFLDLNTGLVLDYLRYTFRNRMLLKYPRHKLADDGVRVASGQPVMTPAVGRAEAIAWFREMEELGLVEGADQFKQELLVERNAQDPNRLDFVLPPDLVNQLRVQGVQIGFLL